MKRLLLVAIFCMVPVAALAHPGKTDRHGGHKCVKACEEWGLYYAEYHLHDKYGRAIRIGSEMDKARPATVRSVVTETVVTALPVTTVTQTVVYRSVTEVHEENILAANPLLWALIVLLLLFLILRRTRSQSEKS